MLNFRYRKFDLKGNGIITGKDLAEGLAGVGVPLNQIKAIITEVDSNQDGMIEYNEFVNFFSQDLTGGLQAGGAANRPASAVHLLHDADNIDADIASAMMKDKPFVSRRASTQGRRDSAVEYLVLVHSAHESRSKLCSSERDLLGPYAEGDLDITPGMRDNLYKSIDRFLVPKFGDRSF